MMTPTIMIKIMITTVTTTMAMVDVSEVGAVEGKEVATVEGKEVDAVLSHVQTITSLIVKLLHRLKCQLVFIGIGLKLGLVVLHIHVGLHYSGRRQCTVG